MRSASLLLLLLLVSSTAIADQPALAAAAHAAAGGDYRTAVRNYEQILEQGRILGAGAVQSGQCVAASRQSGACHSGL